jgi:CRISPR system Cascade subunit CasA
MQIQEYSVSFQASPGGNNYEGQWLHPLTPYFESPDAEIRTIKPWAHTFHYRNWMGLVMDEDREKGKAFAAQVISRNQSFAKAGTLISAFGYELDNAKAVAWREGQMPFYPDIEAVGIKAFQRLVSSLTGAAEQMAKQLFFSARNAAFGTPEITKKGLNWDLRPSDANSTLLESLTSSFWKSTETDFYLSLSQIVQIEYWEEHPEAIFKNWHASVVGKTLQLFEAFTRQGGLMHSRMREVSLAQTQLRRALWSRNLRQKKLGITIMENVVAEVLP